MFIKRYIKRVETAVKYPIRTDIGLVLLLLLGAAGVFWFAQVQPTLNAMQRFDTVKRETNDQLTRAIQEGTVGWELRNAIQSSKDARLNASGELLSNERKMFLFNFIKKPIKDALAEQYWSTDAHDMVFD